MKKREYIRYEMDDYDKAEDEMTDEEVVWTLQFIGRGYIPDYNYTGDEADFEHYKCHMAISKAIKIIKENKENK